MNYFRCQLACRVDGLDFETMAVATARFPADQLLVLVLYV